jgi:O-antigen/teichoic acid export membrane protein
VSLILVATVIAGIAAYVVTWLVPHRIGLASYALFAVFWAFLYLVVGTLSGIQQEVARATRARDGRLVGRVGRAGSFAVVAALSVFTIVVLSAPVWVQAIFPTDGWSLVWPLAAGTASYVFVAVLGGAFYGIAQWLSLALMMTVDALLRLLAVGIALAFTSDVVVLAWAVVLPFPATIALLWLFIRKSIRGRSELDVGYGALSWNVARTILAAASTSAMVSGFPLLLGLTAPNEPRATVGLFILSITLTRAPLIVIAMSMQSYLVVTFRARTASFWRNFLRLQALVMGAGIVLAAVGWVIGPAVFGVLFPGEPRPEGWFIAVLVMSSALVGGLFVAGPAVLARSQHFIYASGWTVAASVTVVSLVLPLDFTARTVTALLAGPIAGAAVFAVYLSMAVRRERVAAD